MKIEARLYDKLEDNKVQCHVCANECIIKPDRLGICRTRKNHDGTLYTLIYGSMISWGSLDPIEKKPLYNFYPGATTYSIASIGCSFKCLHCQNWNISQACPTENGKGGYYDFEDYQNRSLSLVETSPEGLKNKVIQSGAATLAYTYNEPLIWHEWILDTTKLLRFEGIKTILVTNGFSTPEAAEELIEAGIDAANIDIKGITDEFYKKICKVKSVQPVLDTSIKFKEAGVHVEITNLIIPGINDSEKYINKLCSWVVENLGPETPLHFSAYHPDYKIPAKTRTPIETLRMAYEVAKEKGIFFPYVGNVADKESSNTYCPDCGDLLLARHGFSLNNVQVTSNHKCANCGHDLKNELIGKIKDLD